MLTPRKRWRWEVSRPRTSRGSTSCSRPRSRQAARSKRPTSRRTGTCRVMVHLCPLAEAASQAFLRTYRLVRPRQPKPRPLPLPAPSFRPPLISRPRPRAPWLRQEQQSNKRSSSKATSNKRSSSTSEALSHKPKPMSPSLIPGIPPRRRPSKAIPQPATLYRSKNIAPPINDNQTNTSTRNP